MQIDWFTFAAQIVNFLILLVVLRVVLYDRVLRVMRQREEEVGDRLEAVERKEQHVEELEERIQRERAELDQHRDDLLKSMHEDVDRMRAEMLRELREEVQRTRDNWKASLRQEQEGIVHDIEEHLADLVASAVERALADLADASLEGRMIETFFQQLAESDEPGWNDVRHAIRSDPDDVNIRSAHELCKTREKQILSWLRDSVTGEVEASFDVEPSLVAGIEVEVAGRTFGWSINDYVGRLRDDFVAAIARELGPEHGDGHQRRETTG